MRRVLIDVTRDVFTVCGAARTASIGSQRLSLTQPVHVSQQSLRARRIEEVISQRSIEVRHRLNEGTRQIVRQFVRIVRINAEASGPLAEPAFLFRGRRYGLPICTDLPNLWFIHSVKPVHDRLDRFCQTSFGVRHRKMDFALAGEPKKWMY